MIIPITYKGPYPHETGLEWKIRRKKEEAYYDDLLGPVTLTDEQVKKTLKWWKKNKK